MLPGITSIHTYIHTPHTNMYIKKQKGGNGKNKDMIMCTQ